MPDNSEYNSKVSTATNENLFVVGIGASAGGLSALEELFNNLSINSGASFVVIQHLSPDFKSLMKELLERRTTMPVYRVLEGMELEPNSVYLIPPGQNLALEKNVLRLEDRKKDKNKKHELNFPIDLFLTSLAKNYGERSIGVILSGSGSDGTRGLKAINEAGGVALVQDPETAEFDGMPKSAISTGVVNQVLPPKELAQLIHQCVVAPVDFLESESSPSQTLQISPHNLSLIARLLLEREELDFTRYKSSTISRRIHRRCLINSSSSIDDYIKLLESSEAERQILSSDLLINVTHFFRDYPAWQNLENNILPQLISASKPEAGRIKILDYSLFHRRRSLFFSYFSPRSHTEYGQKFASQNFCDGHRSGGFGKGIPGSLPSFHRYGCWSRAFAKIFCSERQLLSNNAEN